MHRDYFSNHALKLRFPWRLYHAPIVRAFAREIERAPGASVLNIGSGPFFELDSLPDNGTRYTISDIDARAVELASNLHGDKIVRADVLQPGEPLPYENGAFELVAAMDVIEHVAPPEPWLQEAWRVLAVGGVLFLTTPDYGSLSLRAIEATALELAARAQGFSRRGLHPTKFNRSRLAGCLAKLDGGSPEIFSLSLGWVLAARVVKQR